MNEKATLLRQMIHDSSSVQVLGVSDGLTARIAHRAGASALWASGLAISVAHGVPDASILTMSEFLDAGRVIDTATPLPVIADCDAGFGDIHSVVRTIREYEKAGIAAVCLEDAEHPKRNSFWGSEHALVPAEQFAAKIHLAKSVQQSKAFMVIARLESFVAGESLEDALKRGMMYAQSGADLILVHSKSKDGADVFSFAEAWRAAGNPRPLVAVPTTYPTIPHETFAEAGFRIVIWANQITRAAVSAMEAAAQILIDNRGSASIEAEIASVSDLFELCSFNKVSEIEQRYHETAQNLYAASLPAGSEKAASTP
jgi:phosphoenolpyruvate phosphomutase